mmetsp:Transcript_19519/g.40544  ORF Transcript_19519/g.40544 Transcript_19519/m.40544 type:complete len:96 (+) Transcript_19519:106-393(+)
MIIVLGHCGCLPQPMHTLRHRNKKDIPPIFAVVAIICNRLGKKISRETRTEFSRILRLLAQGVVNEYYWNETKKTNPIGHILLQFNQNPTIQQMN